MGRRAALVIVAAAVAAGCARDAEDVGDRTPAEELAVAGDTAEGFGTDAPAGVTPVQGGATISGALTATGNFRAAQGGRAPGTVTVTQSAQGSRLLISVQGLTDGAELQPVVVRGGCDVAGAPVHRVGQTIRVGSEGVATLDTQVPVPTAQLLDGTHSVRMQTPAGQGSADVVLACAELPQASVTAGQ